MTEEDRAWFIPPENAHPTNEERIKEVNEALQSGKAVTLVTDHEHESRHTVLYWDQERDILIYSPYNDGRRWVLGYPPEAIGETWLQSMTISIAFADDRKATPVEESNLHHSVYGIRPVEYMQEV